MVATVGRKRLTTFELPAYLSACQRVASWANAQLGAAVVVLTSREDALGADKEIAFAVREPVGAAQQRTWWAKRLLPNAHLKTVDQLISAARSIHVDCDEIGLRERSEAPISSQSTCVEGAACRRARLRAGQECRVAAGDKICGCLRSDCSSRTILTACFASAWLKAGRRFPRIRPALEGC